MQVNPLGRTEKVVDEQGRATEKLSLFSEDVSRLPVLTGSGSPESVVEARQTRLYMDITGSTGSILYVKKFDAVAGNKKEGWVLV